jgi:hypothetical protein
MKQLEYHWAGFHEILYLSIFLKSVDKIQALLKLLHMYKYNVIDALYIHAQCYWYTVHTCIVLLIRVYRYVIDILYTRVLMIPSIHVYGVVYLFEQPVSKRGLLSGYVISLYVK